MSYLLEFDEYYWPIPTNDNTTADPGVNITITISPYWRQCPACGCWIWDVDYRFCPYCGADLNAKYCPHCGKELTE